MACYRQKDYERAIDYLTRYSIKKQDHDTTLYYLYDCYQKINDREKSIRTLEALAGLRVNDEAVYFNLYYYYRNSGEYGALCDLLSFLDPRIQGAFDRSVLLTRKLLAEILSGMANRPRGTDPMDYALVNGYLTRLPDGKVYENDTLTMGNLIILLDQRIEPFYPKKFYSLRRISSHSFIYLPYIRLVEKGILPLDEEIDPGQAVSLIRGFEMIKEMKKQGFFK